MLQNITMKYTNRLLSILQKVPAMIRTRPVRNQNLKTDREQEQKKSIIL